MSPAEPAVKHAVAFIDGQNLFHAAREAFGYTYPNYDVHALAGRLCETRGWQLAQTRFYTGIPDVADNAFWHSFWERKLRVISWQGVHVLRPCMDRQPPIGPARFQWDTSPWVPVSGSWFSLLQRVPGLNPCQGNHLGAGRRGRYLGSWERRERHVLRTHAYAEDPALDARDGLLLLLKRWIEIPA